MDGWMDEWMNGWRDGGWVDGWMDGWVDGWMDGSMGGWMDGWMDGLIDEWNDVCNVSESAKRFYDKALASVMELEYRTKEIGNLKKAGRREYPHALFEYYLWFDYETYEND